MIRLTIHTGSQKLSTPSTRHVDLDLTFIAAEAIAGPTPTKKYIRIDQNGSKCPYIIALNASMEMELERYCAKTE